MIVTLTMLASITHIYCMFKGIYRKPELVTEIIARIKINFSLSVLNMKIKGSDC